MDSYKPNRHLILQLSVAIKQGKFFHLFIDGIYFGSYVYEDVAKCWDGTKGARIIHLCGGRS